MMKYDRSDFDHLNLIEMKDMKMHMHGFICHMLHVPSYAFIVQSAASETAMRTLGAGLIWKTCSNSLFFSVLSLVISFILSWMHASS